MNIVVFVVEVTQCQKINQKITLECVSHVSRVMIPMRFAWDV